MPVGGDKGEDLVTKPRGPIRNMKSHSFLRFLSLALARESARTDEPNRRFSLGVSRAN